MVRKGMGHFLAAALCEITLSLLCLAVKAQEPQASKDSPRCLVREQRLILSDGSAVSLDYRTTYGTAPEYFKKGEHPDATHPIGRIQLPAAFALPNGRRIEKGWHVVNLRFKPGDDAIEFTRTKGLEVLESRWKNLSEDVNNRLSQADRNRDGVIDDKECELAFSIGMLRTGEGDELPWISYSGGDPAFSSSLKWGLVLNQAVAPLSLKEIDDPPKRKLLDLVPTEKAGTFILQITFGRYHGSVLISKIAEAEAKEIPVEAVSPASKAVDRSSPEMTLRTFWSGIQSGNKAKALACTNPARIRQGRHGRDVKKLIEEYRTLDSSEFRYLPGKGRCSIQSPTHNMDYDMEKNDAGEWTIVSIHP